MVVKGERKSGVDKDKQQELRTIENQIRKVKEIRRHWADGERLKPEEKLRQSLTLELLDGALQDLIRKKVALKG